MKTPIDDFTMIIPTYNRPRMLAAAVRSYSRDTRAFRIVVGDSSTEQAQEENAEAIRACDAGIEHIRYSPQIPVGEKHAHLGTLVETPYAMYMADDDIALLDGIFESVRFLRAHEDFIGCHGVYYNARLASEEAVNLGIEYATISMDQAAPIERVLALLVRYQAVAYAVLRRDVFVASFPPTRLQQPHFGELYQAFFIAISGKVAALNVPYIVRNSQLGARDDFLGDGNIRLLHDSQTMAEEYLLMRATLEPLLAPFVQHRSALHIIDIAFAAFMSRAFNLGTVLRILERDGDIGPGSAALLNHISAFPNTLSTVPEHISKTIRAFMESGWPRFG